MVDAVCLHIKQIFRNNKKLKLWVFFPIEETYKYFFFQSVTARHFLTVTIVFNVYM